MKTFGPVSGFIPELDYDNVIFDTWADEFRLKDTFGGNISDCSHLYGMKRGICSFCGAFIGFIGKELDPDLFSRNCYLLARRFCNSNFVVLSPRPLPEDYRLYLFGKHLQDSHKMRNTVYFEENGEYAHCFLKGILPRKLNLTFLKRGMRDWLMANFMDGKTIWINPKRRDMDHPIDYLVANEVLNGLRVWSGS